MAKQQPSCSPMPVLAIRIDVVGRSLQGLSGLAEKGCSRAQPCERRRISLEGYLRSSVLRVLASKIGDRAPLPEDFIAAGGFDDADSETKVKNQASAIVLPLLVRDHLEAKKTKAAEEDDDDDTDEEEEE